MLLNWEKVDHLHAARDHHKGHHLELDERELGIPKL